VQQDMLCAMFSTEPLSEATPTSTHPTKTSIQESMRSSEQTTLSTVVMVTTVTMYQPQPSGFVRMTRRINFGGGRPAMAGTEGSGGNMVILTSVGASVGVLLVVAAALTAVLCVWQCSRRRSKCFSEALHECMMPGTYLNGRRSIHSVQYYILLQFHSQLLRTLHTLLW